jgi:hypothetical protein
VLFIGVWPPLLFDMILPPFLWIVMEALLIEVLGPLAEFDVEKSIEVTNLEILADY